MVTMWIILLKNRTKRGSDTYQACPAQRVWFMLGDGCFLGLVPKCMDGELLFSARNSFQFCLLPLCWQPAVYVNKLKEKKATCRTVYLASFHMYKMEGNIYTWLFVHHYYYCHQYLCHSVIGIFLGPQDTEVNQTDDINTLMELLHWV